MARNLFSVPIFFIVFRETLEAAIIISVLLGLVEQIVNDDPARLATDPSISISASDDSEKHAPDTLTAAPAASNSADPEKKSPTPDAASGEGEADVRAQPELAAVPAVDALSKRRLIRKMRIQIFAGSAIGLLIALAIGAAFIAVWFTKASDLWAKSEDLWEGIFELIASIIIFIMGITMLKLDRAKAKWRVKLASAFDGQHVDGRTRTGKWVLFLLPLITVLREGMEAVVFVGGVTLGQSATSIPIAAIVGLIAGLICGFFIYAFASRSTLTIFLVVMTNFILLIGAGLFSRAAWSFEMHHFVNIVGGEVDDTGGDGPGSYNVHGSVWHLDCCNPENNFDNGGWQIFNALFGWTNSATIGSVLAYALYWVMAVLALVWIKWREGRVKLAGRWESAAGVRRREKREGAGAGAGAGAGLPL